MPDYRYITINNTQFPRPPQFEATRTDVLTNEITTMSGKTIADRLGWKYADMTLEWDALPESQVQELCNLSGEFTITFDDPVGSEITERVIRSSAVAMRHRWTINGVTYWKGVSCAIRFIDTHIE